VSSWTWPGGSKRIVSYSPIRTDGNRAVPIRGPISGLLVNHDNQRTQAEISGLIGLAITSMFSTTWESTDTRGRLIHTSIWLSTI
jgi:hypothetical protein